MAHAFRKPFPLLLISASCLAIQPGSVAAAESGASGEASPLIAIASTPPSPVGVTDASDGMQLMLLVTVNARRRGIVPVRQTDGGLWVDRAAFAQLGLVTPSGGDGLVRLGTLSGVIVRYKEAEQELELVVPAAMLDARTAHLNEQAIANPAAETATGLVMNYDVAANVDRSGVDLGLLSALRAFSPAGVAETTQISRWRPGERGGFDTIRLDTSFTHAFPNRRLSLQIGDVITSGAAWSRPTRMGGLRFGTDFGLQPYFVTSPERRLAGTATLPSRVELFVNGMRRYSGDIEPGPYQIGLGPGRIDGAGRAQVVVTDMLGRVTTQNFSLYDSSRLLRRGLDDWSLEIGATRLDYGLRSFAYDSRPAASLTWRRGLSDWLTLEAHAEGRADFGNLGLGGALALGQAGVVTASAATSQGRHASGHRVTAGYSWQGYGFHLSGELRRSFGRYVDLGSDRFAPAPPDSTFVQAGYSDPLLGAISLSYTSLSMQDEVSYRYAGLDWSHRVWRNGSLRLSYNHDFEDRRRSALYLSLQVTLAARTYGSAGYELNQGDARYAMSLQHSAPLAGGLGWRADLRETPNGVLAMAQIDMLTGAGAASAALRSVYGRLAGYGSYSGALVFMDGGLFASRRIDDAFAVVSTGGVGGVPVTLGNALVGRTNGRGRLLVTRLNPWQNNVLGIDPRDLPPSVMFDRVQAFAVPSDRAGARVRFAMREFRALTLRAVTPEGTPLPVGTPVAIAGTASDPVTLGLDGTLYLEDPPPGLRLVAHTSRGACEISPPPAFAANGIAQLGEQICQPLAGSSAADAAPPPRLDYGALPETGQTLTLVDEQGNMLPEGAEVADAASRDAPFRLARGARIYIAAAAHGSRFVVTMPAGTCRFEVPDDLAVGAQGAPAATPCRRDL